MWFVFLALGFAVLIAGGLWARGRLGAALDALGVGGSPVRWVRRAVTWLWFGYPVVMVATVLGSLASGRAVMPRFDGPVATWLLVYPFFVSLLVLVQALPYLLAIELATLLGRARAAGAARRAAAGAGPRPRGRWRARATVAVLAVFAVYTPARIILERGDLRVREHHLQASAGAPSSSAPPPLRIAFVSDLQRSAHTGEREAQRVIRLVTAMRADVVLSGGDWIDTGPRYIADAARAAGALPSRLGTYSVRGDHEHFAYFDRQRSLGEVERALTSRGVAVGANEVRWLEHHGRRVAVLLLDYNYVTRTPAQAIEPLLAQVAGADYAIAVTHQLDRRLATLLAGKVDLVLAGHTHGGQVNPAVGPKHVSLARLETPYVDGRYQLGATTIIVTAGVGYSVVPFRYASPGSLELVEVSW